MRTMLPLRRPSFSVAAAAAAFSLLGLAAGATAGPHHCSPAGGSELFAAMPVTSPFFPPTGPTYPEGVALLGGRVITSGPANFGTAGNGSPSQLTIFDETTGALRAEVGLVGEDLSQEHALSELFAYQQYVYAPSTQLGVVRFRFDGPHDDAPEQQNYSSPFCSVTIPFPCLQPTDKCPADIRPGLPPLPNGIVVDKGDVYVTDSLQGIVWKMKKAAPAQLPVSTEVLFCARELQGSGTEGLGLFGANGIAAIGDWLYVSVTFGPFGPGGPTSPIYRLRKDGTGSLETVYTYLPVEVAPGIFVPPIADGLRWDDKGKRLFVVLGGQNQVSELELAPGGATGTEVARYSRTDADHPFFNPSTIALGDDGLAYVTNHAITCCLPGDPNPACGGCFNAQDYFGVVRLCTN